MSTADKLQQLRLERQKSDLSYKLQALQSQLERCEEEKNALAAESGNKIKQALSLLDTARKEIDKLKREKEALSTEVTELRRQNAELRSVAAAATSTTRKAAAPPATSLSPDNNAAAVAGAAHHGGQNGTDHDQTGVNGSSTNHHHHPRTMSGSPDHRMINGTTDSGLIGTTARVGGNDEGVELSHHMTGGEVDCEESPDHRSAARRSRVVARRTSTVDQEEKPMSMAERMSMFEGGNSGAGGGGGSFGKGANRNSWRDKNKSSPQTKLADEEKDTIASPVTKRQHKTSQKARDNRHSSPANMYSPKQVKNAAPAPTPAAEAAPAQPTAAARGKSKLRTAFSGMKAAMETEKEHKGISGGGGGGFMGLINQVAPKNPVKRAQSVAAPGSAQSKKQALLHWCKRMTEGKAHVDIKNFSSSWNNGMAFCALFHHFIPDQIPYDTLDPKNREYNFRLAFTEGEKAGVTALLDVEDMVDMKNPEWMSVMTYVSLIYNHFNGIRVGGPRLPPMPGQE